MYNTNIKLQRKVKGTGDIMRKFSNSEEHLLESVTCNKCGKMLPIKKGIVMEGIFSIDYCWGYFSDKDGEIHSIDLCEKCYNEIVENFKIPVDVTDNNELI